MADRLREPFKGEDDTDDASIDQNRDDGGEPQEARSQPQQVQREASTLTPAEYSPLSPDRAAAVGGGTSDTTKRLFDGFDDSSEQAKVRHPSSFSTPPKRVRHDASDQETSPRQSGRRRRSTRQRGDSRNYAEVSSSDEETSPQRPSRSRPSIQRQVGGRHGHQGLTDFPTLLEPLPAGLTLQQICQDYPNHLYGENLRPFIRAGWNARRIWGEMRSGARISASTTRPWNKLEHRLNKESKKMNKETDNTQGQQSGTQQPSSGPVGGSFGQPLPFPMPSGYQIQPPLSQSQEGGTQQPTFGPAGGTIAQALPIATTSANQNPSAVDVAVSRYQQLFRAETAEQRRVLTNILAARNPTWRFRSPREQVGLLEQEWLRRMRILEREFARNHGIDAEGLQIPQTSVVEMLRRLNVFVQMSLQTAHPPPANFRLAAFQQQLWVLQEWTIQWTDELQQLGRYPASGPSTVLLGSSSVPHHPTQAYMPASTHAPSHGYVGYTPSPQYAGLRPSQGYTGYTPAPGNAPVPSYSSAMGSGDLTPTPTTQEDANASNIQPGSVAHGPTNDDFSYEALLKNDDLPRPEDWVGEAFEKNDE